MREVYLAGGCYWGVEKYLSSLKGVAETEVGFANGAAVSPTYAQVKHGDTGHAETVRVRYDETVLPLPSLLRLFFRIIDPTSVNRQGEDAGEQYRTGIYWTDETDRPVEMKTVNLKELVPETAEPYQSMAEFRGRVFRCEAAEDLPVRGEEASLRRIVSILCDNAVKYTPEGGEIRLRAYSEGKNAVIETENPPAEPLTEEDCARLFDRFYRGDKARDREKQNGYGIGLSIAQAVAARHGGTAAARLTQEGTLKIRLTVPLDR